MDNEDIIEIDSTNITWEVDDPSNPYSGWVHEDVLRVQEELREQQLRDEHPELKEAYENYAKLLAKYGFWDKITK